LKADRFGGLPFFVCVMVSWVMRLWFVSLLPGCCGLVHAQWPGVEFKPEPGTVALHSRYDHAVWGSPESLVRDLRSDNEDVRSKALLAFGYPGAQLNDEIPAPDQLQLRFAPIGEDKTLQAIVVITVGAVMAYAAVAVPESRGWRRIGVFFCWCKYEDNPLQFAQARLSSASGKVWSELVVSPSGGGTGEYARDEVHFRVHNGALRKVMSFVSFRRSCQSELCVVETRTLSGNQVVSSRDQINAKNPPENATCASYQWDEKAFIWKQSGPATRCSKSGSLP
jgi:hypothetical protein